MAPRDPADGTLSRRGFLGRAATASFAAYAAIAGVASSRALARPGPKPCRVGCRPVSKTGCACGGSSTPPMPTPPERWTSAPIWAQEPTVAHVSTIVRGPTQAPMFTNPGMRTTPSDRKEP